MTKLDIISDPICPWCFIGKAKLDRALEAHPNHDFVIEWHPYQLNPDMPDEGMDRREYLEAKFGGRQQAAEFYVQIEAAADEIGLEVDFGAITRTPKSLDAHRLIHWAGLEGRQNAVVDRLFRGFFKDGKDLSDIRFLVETGTAVGMDHQMVERLLNSGADVKDIQERDRNARARGVTGVPCFVIADRYAVTGAQQPELWARVIEELGSLSDSDPTAE